MSSLYLTWGEIKGIVESAGVKDDTPIEMWDVKTTARDLAQIDIDLHHRVVTDEVEGSPLTLYGADISFREVNR